MIRASICNAYTIYIHVNIFYLLYILFEWLFTMLTGEGFFFTFWGILWQPLWNQSLHFSHTRMNMLVVYGC